jgi:HEAT repeat protein
VKYFCPCCWAETPASQEVCPRCGTEIEREWGTKSYVQKLIAALRNPERMTPVRAAWILGKLGAREAVPALMDLAQSSPDLFIREAAVEALGEIGDPRSIELLRVLSRSTSVLVRRAARQALGRLKTRLADLARTSHSADDAAGG